MNYKDGFFIKIGGSNNEIYDIFNVNNKNIFLCKDGVYKINFGDKKNKHYYKKIIDINYRSLSIQRILKTFCLILEKIEIENNKKEEFCFYLWDSFEKFSFIENKLNELNKDIEYKNIKTKSNYTLPPIEDIKNLKNDVFFIFRNIKLIYINVFKILKLFNYLNNFSDREEAHFNKHLNFISDNFKDSILFEIFTKHEDCVVNSMEIRNAMEHEKDGQKVLIKNIHYKNNKINKPTIIYNLKKRRNFVSGELDLIKEINGCAKMLLEFFEDTVAFALSEKNMDNIFIINYNHKHCSSLNNFNMKYCVDINVNIKNHIKNLINTQ